MFCLNVCYKQCLHHYHFFISACIFQHLVRDHPIWSEPRLWIDAFFELKGIRTTMEESTPQAASPSPTSSSGADEIDKLFSAGGLVRDDADKDKYASTLVAERLIYAMLKLGAAKSVVQEFIDFVVSIEDLKEPYKEYLNRYLTISTPAPS